MRDWLYGFGLYVGLAALGGALTAGAATGLWLAAGRWVW